MLATETRLRVVRANGWDTCIVVPTGSDRWWWNAWHPATSTERSGEAGSHTEAHDAMGDAIQRAETFNRSILGGTDGDENPISSIGLRLVVRPPVRSDGPGPHSTRPFGLRFARVSPAMERPALRYSHELQVAVGDDGRPLVESGEKAKPKEWESKTYSDGDEGQEEECWGWEEQ